MLELGLWGLGAFAVVLGLGAAVRRFGTPGLRTYLYAHLSAALTGVVALAGVTLADAGDLAALGLKASTIAAIALSAKFADWLNQLIQRRVTQTDTATAVLHAAETGSTIPAASESNS